MERKKQIMAFVICTVLLAAVVSGMASAKEAAIIKGPYLQNVAQNSIVIMWETDEATPSVVEYDGRRESDPNNVKIHEIHITGLLTGTCYNYRVCIDGSDNSWTDWSTFCTAPDATQPYCMVVYGDTRTKKYDAHADVVHAIIADDPEIVLHTGDFVDKGKCYKYWHKQLFSPARDLMIDTPLFPVLGNHEYEDCLTSPQKMWYYDFFSIPGNEQWYAFTYGCARFIVLDTNEDRDPNADFSPGSAQYNWLIGELQSDEYTAAKWHFVFFHHPPYTSGESHYCEPGVYCEQQALHVREYLVPLFEEYCVDMVFNGHSHNYERSYVDLPEIQNDGVYYIVTGGGGARLHDCRDNVNQYSQLCVKAFHHCTLDVTPQQVTLTAKRNDGSVIDIFGISEAPAVVAVPVLTPLGLVALIGLLSLLAVGRIKRRGYS